MGEVARFVGRKVVLSRTDNSESHLGVVRFALEEKCKAVNPVCFALPRDRVADFEREFVKKVDALEVQGHKRHTFDGTPSAFSLAQKRFPHLFAMSRATPVDSYDADVEQLG